jgi:hypothetical protein
MASSWKLPTFANEEALDWLDDLVDERDMYFIHNTLEIIADYPPDEKPEPWDCACALAAAEMVAAAKGHPPVEFPMEAQEWLEAYGLEVDPEVTGLASKALERIASNSLLKDELDASGELPVWHSEVNSLRSRLGIHA